MRTLITGGAGFIGGHLAERLIADGHAVEVLDDLSTGRRSNLAAILDHPLFTFTEGSVANDGLVGECIARSDRVFHLAAAVGVQRVVDRPVETILTNVLGSEIVLRHAAEQRKRILITSSSEIYGKSEAVPFAETDDCVLGPPQSARWSYATSKAVTESLATAYASRDSETIIARLFNTIGPRQVGSYGMVVPRFVAAALAGDPIRIFGDGTQTRCFCHVADVVDALVRLMDADAAVGRVFNIGSTEEVTIEQLADLILELTASASAKQFTPYAEAYGKAIDDMLRRVPDLRAIRKAIAWQPTSPLRETLRQIIASYLRTP